MDESRLLHPVFPDSCRRLGVGRSTIYRLISEGELRPVKIGDRTLIPEAELQNYVARLIEASNGPSAA